MAKDYIVGDIDSRKELNQYLSGMSNEVEATRLKMLIKEYGLQREVEAYEKVKELLDEIGDMEAWTYVNGFPVSAFGSHTKSSEL
jgi:hypothetical protein